MPIDANIAMGYRPARIEPQANAFERAIRLQGLQRQNALGELQTQEAQAGLNERAAARQVMTQPGFDISNQEQFNKLQGVAPAQADALLKSHLERVKTKAESDYKEAQTKGLTQEQAHKEVAFGLQSLVTVDSPQAAVQWTMQGAQRLGLKPEELQKALSEIPTDPAKFVDWKERQRLSGVDLSKQFDIAAGAARDKETGRHNLTAEGNTVLGIKTAAATAAAGHAVTLRGQKLTDDRAREANGIQGQLVTQEKQLKVNELQDKADQRDRTKTASVSAVANQIGVIDKALNHTGRETATGTSGVIDPRNYIAGTNATDFKVVLDQIGGAAFLQAFESLKGGGQITEVEGKKATDAIARLNRAQSDGEFKTSLNDLRKVMTDGYQRLSGKSYGGGDAKKTVTRTGTSNGRKVVQYSDGSTAYAD